MAERIVTLWSGNNLSCSCSCRHYDRQRTMQSGLRSYFSRPAKTNGATPKRMRGFQTPTGNFAEFPSPAVSDRTFRSGFFRTPNPYISRYPQVRSSRYATRPASPVSLSTSSIGTGGGHRSSAVNRNLNLTENEELFPVPCHTLQTRLTLSVTEVESRPYCFSCIRHYS